MYFTYAGENTLSLINLSELKNCALKHIFIKAVAHKYSPETSCNTPVVPQFWNMLKMC